MEVAAFARRRLSASSTGQPPMSDFAPGAEWDMARRCVHSDCLFGRLISCEAVSSRNFLVVPREIDLIGPFAARWMVLTPGDAFGSPGHVGLTAAGLPFWGRTKC